jgi:inner membrane protein
MALARAASGHDDFAPFRRFARFLVLDHIETRRDGRCAWFTDLRFSLPELPPSFRYGLCQTDGEPGWRLSRLHGVFHID